MENVIICHLSWIGNFDKTPSFLFLQGFLLISFSTMRTNRTWRSTADWETTLWTMWGSTSAAQTRWQSKPRSASWPNMSWRCRLYCGNWIPGIQTRHRSQTFFLWFAVFWLSSCCTIQATHFFSELVHIFYHLLNFSLIF